MIVMRILILVGRCDKEGVSRAISSWSECCPSRPTAHCTQHLVVHVSRCRIMSSEQMVQSTAIAVWRMGPSRSLPDCAYWVVALVGFAAAGGAGQ